MMPGAPKADNPADYVAQLDGWRLATVEALRAAAKAAAPLEERIKWTHLVYFSNGPVLLIRAEAARVLFGFWRGKRLFEIEPRLKPGGKFGSPPWSCAKAMRSIRRSPPSSCVPRLRSTASLGDPSKPSL